MTIDSAKVLAAVQTKVQALVDYANGPADGFGNNDLNITVFQERGFKTPEAYCAAESTDYRLCQQLLAAGQS